MSKHSLNIAVKYGESLREFRDQSEAEDYYISYKDDLLNRLKAISTQASAFFPDYTIESLKKLEKWYFDLYEKQSFDKAGSTQEDFESMMSVYWGEVTIKKEAVLMNTNAEKLRKKYMDNPPEGMTSGDIRRMSEDDLLDMDYSLNEDDLFDDEAGVEGFYIF